MDELVTKDIAQAVKTLGFNLRTTHYIDNNHSLNVTDNLFGWDYNNSHKGWYSLPTHDQVLSFFLGNYGIKTTVDSSTLDENGNFKDWYYTISNGSRKKFPNDPRGIYHTHDHRDGHDSHKKARRACVFKVIEILKKKK